MVRLKSALEEIPFTLFVCLVVKNDFPVSAGRRIYHKEHKEHEGRKGGAEKDAD